MIQEVQNITAARRLTQENISFFLSTTGLLMGKSAEADFEGRVFLSLAFPFKTQTEFVSVQNEDKEEIGMIASLSDFQKEARELLSAELQKKYFSPKIQKIVKITDYLGSTFWDCQTDFGLLKFTVKDPHRSIIRIGEERAFVVDVDGCRYEIESLSALDKKSHSKIELYL